MKDDFNDLGHLQGRLRELEVVFDYCFDGISIIDKQGKILRSNPKQGNIKSENE